MDIQTISFESYTVSYFEFGDPAGQPLVIIPGLALKSVMESAGLIAEQYRSLAERHRLIVIDRRHEPGEGCSIEGMAEDTLRVLDHLGICRADFYGVSQGGMIAQCIALRRQALVRRMILCSTAAWASPAAKRIIARWCDLAASGDVHELVRALTQSIYSASYCAAAEGVFQAYAESVTEAELRRFQPMAGCINAFDLRNQLKKFSFPLLVIGAGQDRIFGTADAAALAEKTGGSLRIFPHASHAVYDENPDILNLIAAFLEDSENG